MAKYLADYISAPVTITGGEGGYLIEVTDSRTLFFLPPLILTKSEAKKGVDIIRSACGINLNK